MAKLVFSEDAVVFGTGIYVENQNPKPTAAKQYIDFLVNFQDTEDKTECLMFTEKEVKQFFVTPHNPPNSHSGRHIIKFFPGELGQMYPMVMGRRIGYIGKLDFETSERTVFISLNLINKALERAKKNGEDVTQEQSVSKFLKTNIIKFLKSKLF